MERTARGKFEGGDAAWEEERLGSYSHSEVRLVEIQEKLCSSVERGKDQVSMIADVLISKCLLLSSLLCISVIYNCYCNTNTHTVCILQWDSVKLAAMSGG